METTMIIDLVATITGISIVLIFLLDNMKMLISEEFATGTSQIFFVVPLLVGVFLDDIVMMIRKKFRVNKKIEKCLVRFFMVFITMILICVLYAFIIAITISLNEIWALACVISIMTKRSIKNPDKPIKKIKDEVMKEWNELVEKVKKRDVNGK